MTIFPRFLHGMALAALLALLALAPGACAGHDHHAAAASDDAADDDAASDDVADDTGDDTGGSGTRYPIVLIHGFCGWGYLSNFAYFYGVADRLAAEGYEVLEPQLTAVGTIEERAAQLAEQIDSAYPGRRVNLVAHSQGGVDARYLISSMGWGDRVASLTTIAAPHRGTALADVAEGLIPNLGQEIIAQIMALLGWDWDAVGELTRSYMTTVFNPSNPDWPGVAYYSWYGDGADLWTPFIATHAILALLEGCNDGVIGCDSAKWGILLGELPADHAAEIGQPFGLIAFDWLGFYDGVAAFLRGQGF